LPDVYVAPKKPVLNLKFKKKKAVRNLIPKRLKKSLDQIGLEPGTNSLGAFQTLPEKISFSIQDGEETIILLLRRHLITNLNWLILTALMVLTPLLLKVFPLLDFLPLRFQLIAVLMWYLFIISFVFEKFLSWFFNVYIITDERLIDVDFFSLVYREVSQAKIDKIQDVTYKTGGLIRTLFNFGDIFVQTAGKVQQIEFECIPKPTKVVKLINSLMSQEEQEKIEGRIR